MKNQQLRAIYTNPKEISDEQTLLEQLKEFAEIGFNRTLKKHIGANHKNIHLFTSVDFDASKYNQEYLDFINAMILALTSAKKSINTSIIRRVYSENQHYSRHSSTKEEYPSITDIPDDSTLKKNVIERLDAFKNKLEAIRNQQLLLKARALVDLADKDLLVNQKNLRSMEVDYLQLCSSFTLESCVAFEKKFALFFGEQSISAFRNSFAQRILMMDQIVKTSKGTVHEEVIREMQAKLDSQIENFGVIERQATKLMNLSKLLKQIKAIEGIVAQKANDLQTEKDADRLGAFIQFIEEQEKDIQRIKGEIQNDSEIDQQTNRAIEQIEQAIKQKKLQAISLLENMREKSSEVHPIEAHQMQVQQDIPRESSNRSDPKNEEALNAKRDRLQQAITLINTYKKTIENEGNTLFSVTFFHKSRNTAKIRYCDLLAAELTEQHKGLNFESNLHEIINQAHKRVIETHGAETEITKGGSYFGTSRMLSLQRLLGIDEAWNTKGHSKFLGFSTQSDLHGLKTSGVVGDAVHRTVKNFYLVAEGSDEPFQEIKNQAFPKAVTKNPQPN